MTEAEARSKGLEGTAKSTLKVLSQLIMLEMVFHSMDFNKDVLQVDPDGCFYLYTA